MNTIIFLCSQQIPGGYKSIELFVGIGALPLQMRVTMWFHWDVVDILMAAGRVTSWLRDVSFVWIFKKCDNGMPALIVQLVMTCPLMWEALFPFPCHAATLHWSLTWFRHKPSYTFPCVWVLFGLNAIEGRVKKEWAALQNCLLY